jgi:hypothetical protein
MASASAPILAPATLAMPVIAAAEVPDIAVIPAASALAVPSSTLVMRAIPVPETRNIAADQHAVHARTVSILRSIARR